MFIQVCCVTITSETSLTEGQSACLTKLTPHPFCREQTCLYSDILDAMCSGWGKSRHAPCPPTESELVCPKMGGRGMRTTLAFTVHLLSATRPTIYRHVSLTHKNPQTCGVYLFSLLCGWTGGPSAGLGGVITRLFSWKLVGARTSGKPPSHVRSPAGSLSSSILSFPGRPDGFLPWCSGIQESESECLISLAPNVTGSLLLSPID